MESNTPKHLIMLVREPTPTGPVVWVADLTAEQYQALLELPRITITLPNGDTVSAVVVTLPPSPSTPSHDTTTGDDDQSR